MPGDFSGQKFAFNSGFAISSIGYFTSEQLCVPNKQLQKICV